MCVAERALEVRVAWQVGVERVVVKGSGWVSIGWGEGVVEEGLAGLLEVVDVAGWGGGEVVVGGFEGEVAEGPSIGALEVMVGVRYGAEAHMVVVRGCRYVEVRRVGWFMSGGVWRRQSIDEARSFYKFQFMLTTRT
ncbi:hypothetical protein VC83_08437 [Pseudogymnoascus destructans]|uniref:Uncharacterized protein n=1 Tax=Pseudogymnoascus destructans TaxID=655981 RepID=A0A177A0K2_9PEZI|nr:uncharacterized protein VC83_08437 [Pseudogymnoascus destructans]OAF55110.1 hypothetical protein VC83_08437 [Pseudogymnoascus destructans]